MSLTTELRETDTKARITLPKGFANSTVLIEVVNDVELVIRKAKVVPLKPFEEYHFIEDDPIVISDEGRAQFFAALENPPPPNEALKKLMAGN
jgi:hypothetical protein